MELLGLAGQLVVGAVLEQAAESAAVEPPCSGWFEASQGLLDVAVDGVRCDAVQGPCDLHSLP